MWYCDLTVDVPNPTYGAFIRLALARYQPYAIKQVQLSRVVLADFAQLTPRSRCGGVSRSVLPANPPRDRIGRGGPAGPGPGDWPSSRNLRMLCAAQQDVNVRVQKRRTDFSGNLGWQDALPTEATVIVDWNAPFPTQPDLTQLDGSYPVPRGSRAGDFRLVIEEHEYFSANHTFDETVGRTVLHEQPSRSYTPRYSSSTTL
jgi:hypothetical protein